MSCLKFIVQLRGGLGNQMFQYAFARSLSLSLNATLEIDKWTGFATDFKYRRKYELDTYNLDVDYVSRRSIFPLAFTLLGSKVDHIVNNSTFSAYMPFYVLREEDPFWPHKIHTYCSKRPFWITGYWQNPQYMLPYEQIINSELTPPLPFDPKYILLAEKMLNEPSLAIGIRLYEESQVPQIHCSNGSLKTADEINKILSTAFSAIPGVRPFLFCTHRSSFLDALDLPKNTVYITHDEGYTSPTSRLWLLTKCRHHIFTNSTFYWWGAWLSKLSYTGCSQIIYAADNFINRNCLPNHWLSF